MPNLSIVNAVVYFTMGAPREDRKVDCQGTSGQRPATRRRGSVLREAIFAAALDRLRADGYAGLTMEGIAAAAGTGKAALYRRWPNKEALITEALEATLPSLTDVAPQDSVREDLLALLGCFRDALVAASGAAFQVLKAEPGQANVVHAIVRRRIFEPYRQRAIEALGRRIERGEVRPVADAPLIANVGPAMLIHYSVTQSPEIPEEYVVAVVDDVLLPLLRP